MNQYSTNRSTCVQAETNAPRACVWIVVSLLSATTSWIQPVIAASQDDYTAAIEAEGNRLEYLGKAKREHEMLMRQTPTAGAPKRNAPSPHPTASKLPAPPAASAAATTPVTKSQFESALHERLPGSYALYEMLEPAERDAVFREYENAGTEGTIRFLPAVNKIIALSSKGKTR